MHRVRHLLIATPMAAWAVIALALMVRVLVPAGYMPGLVDGSVTLELCSGYGPQAPLATAMPTAGMDHAMMDHATMDHGAMGHGGKGHHSAHADTPCPFAAAALPVIGGTDAVLLAVALAYIIAMGWRPVARRKPRTAPRLRPPLRGPPRLVSSPT
ncbi:hypothetical protein [Novosphingobium lentum]|uniref:hypothetical protein n=1 Tax=Novosphingobium lentum TaxID=145287 RepID=UPI00082CEC0D|nr:hypothetical protein [Novosphingobium lentum]